jgi:hypothetical protein
MTGEASGSSARACASVRADGTHVPARGVEEGAADPPLAAAERAHG